MTFHPFFVCARCERPRISCFTRDPINCRTRAWAWLRPSGFAPRAVTRNTIKRGTRELFRLTSLPPLDCIVRLSRPLNTKADAAISAALKAQLRMELRQLFEAQRLPGTE